MNKNGGIMKKNILLIVFIIAITITFLFCFRVFNKKSIIMIEDKNNLLSKYNELLENIENNMNTISINNSELNSKITWTYYNLKMDDDMKYIYDQLIKDIRVCYVYITDVENTYSNSNFLKRFVDSNRISKEQFDKIMRSFNDYNDSCLNSFLKYEEWFLIKNSEIEELKVAVKPIILFKQFNNPKIDNYEDLFKYEYQKVSLINNITNFLKYKYNAKAK